MEKRGRVKVFTHIKRLNQNKYFPVLKYACSQMKNSSVKSMYNAGIITCEGPFFFIFLLVAVRGSFMGG